MNHLVPLMSPTVFLVAQVGGGSSKLALQLSSKRKAKPGYGSSEGLTLGITPLNRGTRSVLSASS